MTINEKRPRKVFFQFSISTYYFIHLSCLPFPCRYRYCHHVAHGSFVHYHDSQIDGVPFVGCLSICGCGCLCCRFSFLISLRSGLLSGIISFKYLPSFISLIILLHFPVSSFNCPILSLTIIRGPFDIPVSNSRSFSSPVIGRLLCIWLVIVSISVKYIAAFYRTISRCLPLFVGAIVISVSVKYITDVPWLVVFARLIG